MKTRMLSLALLLAVLLSVVPAPAYAVTYSSWSGWSTETPSDSPGRVIESRDTVVGYHMVTYLTMTYGGLRQYRSYSVGGNYAGYGLRPQYGEHHYTYYADKASIDSADTCAEGGYVNYAANTAGYNMGSGKAYV
ncbi:MAG: hypothetical protein K6G54_06895, partial [Oscillospiraceae bacterium]|nr:hypothetical protein [Oscillospiraceae bacterium]